MAATRAQQGPRPVAPRALAAAGLPTTRARTLRRRRDVFVILLATAGVTLVMGVLLSIKSVLYLNLVADALLVAYVALLIRQRGARAEQEMKVRFLPTTQPEPAMYRRRPVVMEPALLRRSAN